MPFVDSNIWIASENENDKNNERAVELVLKIKDLDKAFVTSGIVHEVVNYLFKIKNKYAAMRMLDFFLEAENIEIKLLNPDTWNRTIKRFRELNLSLTDAQIIACMEEEQDNELYTFDPGFKQYKWLKIIK